jgi:hypothetical protein
MRKHFCKKLNSPGVGAGVFKNSTESKLTVMSNSVRMILNSIIRNRKRKTKPKPHVIKVYEGGEWKQRVFL